MELRNFLHDEQWAALAHRPSGAVLRCAPTIPCSGNRMGEIVTRIELENATDRGNVRDGLREEAAVRRTSVEGVVNSSMMMSVLPQNVVEPLGLTIHGKVVVSYANERKKNAAWPDP